MLSACKLQGGYGAVQVLFGADVQVDEGQVVALVGRNGMGKTTTIRMLTGELVPRDGEISFAGQSIVGVPEFRIARLGIGLVPEGRQVFPNLTVEEHLTVAARAGEGGRAWTVERVLDLFPRLGERQKQFAKTLSGGEQQMLAIGRALLTNPRLLILDEATEGLAPLVRREIWMCLEAVAKTGLSVIVVDKNIKALCRIAHRFFVLSKGKTVWTGNASEFAEAADVHRQYLGV
ncbi:ABC transporter ATP-binding protein [Microvirga sp. BT350]|uniref:ABC transporter ATP-binding protein n=1 Tax=Microvirga alba TaxID=2791025 RepID=A0A931BTD9_9HYPH|nr:ABC transporter ATP-binding protein [Microvirga alba]